MGNVQRIVFYVVDGFQALDLFGPLDAFAAAGHDSGHGYEFCIAAPESGPVRTASGATVLADWAIEEVGEVDTLILTGGVGPRRHVPRDAERGALERVGKAARRRCSVCTGTFLLCRLGFADGRRVATHWRHTEELARACPQVTVDPGALFVRDGPVWSSAGITAGIDMALAMVSEDAGAAVAAAVARQLVVYLRRPGDQAQFSAPLAAQSGDAGRLGEVLSWLADHLDESIGVDALAARASMSPRHFSRVFRESLGMTPARFIEKLRLDRARLMLADGQARVSAVAAAAGYPDADTFRRAFERRFSVAPNDYRARFRTDAEPAE